MAQSHVIRFGGAAMLALALSACGAKPPKELPPEPGSNVSTTVSTTDTQTAPVNQTVAGPPADFTAQMMGRDTIHFALDKYNIDPVAGSALQGQAAWLLKYPLRHATIEGHADERGTRDYNLALGERRATAAKNFLVSLGVAADRLTTVSYGKERPVDTASTEEAWAKNRRAVTVVVE